MASSDSQPSDSTRTPIFGAGSQEDKLTEDIQPLLAAGWKLSDDRLGLEKTFQFKTFRVTFYDFMIHVAARCMEANHHPEWQNVSCSRISLGYGL
jgi:4a-hydroxytetrahydrobiopterin dehydratase